MLEPVFPLNFKSMGYIVVNLSNPTKTPDFLGPQLASTPKRCHQPLRGVFSGQTLCCARPTVRQDPTAEEKPTAAGSGDSETGRSAVRSDGSWCRSPALKSPLVLSGKEHLSNSSTSSQRGLEHVAMPSIALSLGSPAFERGWISSTASSTSWE